MSNSEKPEAAGGVFIDIDVLLGHIELEGRNVRIAPGTYEHQGRSKRYNRHGVLVETTPWEAVSRITNVPDNLAYLLA